MPHEPIVESAWKLVQRRNAELQRSNQELRLEIAKRHRVEQELRLSEERLQLIIESAADAIVTADAEGRILLVNKRTETMFGYSREELMGETVDIFLPRERRAQHAMDRQEYMKSPRPLGTDTGRVRYGIHKDGRCIPLNLALTPLRVQGQMHVLATIVDITEHEQAKRSLNEANASLTNSNQELEQFAYAASHDLQEPLRKISSYAQLLREECGEHLDTAGHDYLDVVIDGAHRLKTLVSDLLSLSRITTRGKALSPTAASDCLQTAIENLEVIIKESGARVTSHRLPVVLADKGQLILLFQNLVGNAIKYCGASVPKIHVGGRDVGEHFEFFVQDNGIGIESKFHERIFEIFQRLHNRREYSGTGIGLAICQRIVERFGGKIWVDSAPGRGSTFYFTINVPATTPAPNLPSAALTSQVP